MICTNSHPKQILVSSTDQIVMFLQNQNHIILSSNVKFIFKCISIIALCKQLRFKSSSQFISNIIKWCHCDGCLCMWCHRCFPQMCTRYCLPWNQLAMLFTYPQAALHLSRKTVLRFSEQWCHCGSAGRDVRYLRLLGKVHCCRRTCQSVGHHRLNRHTQRCSQCRSLNSLLV